MVELPPEWESWSAETRNAWVDSIKYAWREVWARPEQLMPDLNLPWDAWIIMAGRGAGKALAEWSMIHTKRGFIKFGDIRPGDQVIAPDGTWTNVTFVSIPEYKDTYKITFDDGAEVYTCLEHQWVTWTHRDRKQYQRSDGKKTAYPFEWWSFKDNLHDSWDNVVGQYGPEVRTTQDIMNTLTHSARKDDNHSIPLVAPVQGDGFKWQLDPYVVGYWLGDGDTARPMLAIGPQDRGEALKTLADCGVLHTSGFTPKAGGGDTGAAYFPRLKDLILCDVGYKEEKQFPPYLMQSTVEQRIAFLQGLLDSDGGLARYSGKKKSSAVEFCTTNRNMAEGMMNLLWSLGQKPRGKWSPAGYKDDNGNYVQCKDRFRIVFRPTIQVFRLPRKANALDLTATRSQGLRSCHRMIRSIELYEKAMVKCISVDHPSRMYCTGAELIPTHNTRTGAEAIREFARDNPEAVINIVGMTSGAVRDTVLEGPAGILSVCPPSEVKKYNRSLGQVTFSSGARALTYSAVDPDKLRGSNSSMVWFDELSSFTNAQATFDMAMMGLRLGRHPRFIVTTTPKPHPLVIDLVGRASRDPEHYLLTRGSTFANAANLPASFIEGLKARYEGTTLGRQELYAELILDDPHALWTRALIDNNRRDAGDVPRMSEIVVAVDPSVSASSADSETGIIVAGRDTKGIMWVLEDASLSRPKPDEWARRVVEKYKQYGAQRVVVEASHGFDLLTHLLHTIEQSLPIKKVYARVGKGVRAEPIHALTEQGKVQFVGLMPHLCDQLCAWVPGNVSPDRLDAFVWAGTHLMLGGGMADITAPGSANTGGFRLPSVVSGR